MKGGNSASSGRSEAIGRRRTIAKTASRSLRKQMRQKNNEQKNESQKDPILPSVFLSSIFLSHPTLRPRSADETPWQSSVKFTVSNTVDLYFMARSGVHARRFGGFKALAKILDFVQLAGPAAFFVPGRFTDPQHDRAAYIAQAAEKDIAFFGGQFDLQQSVHLVGSSLIGLQSWHPRETSTKNCCGDIGHQPEKTTGRTLPVRGISVRLKQRVLKQ